MPEEKVIEIDFLKSWDAQPNNIKDALFDYARNDNDNAPGSAEARRNSLKQGFKIGKHDVNEENPIGKVSGFTRTIKELKKVTQENGTYVFVETEIRDIQSAKGFDGKNVTIDYKYEQPSLSDFIESDTKKVTDVNYTFNITNKNKKFTYILKPKLIPSEVTFEEIKNSAFYIEDIFNEAENYYKNSIVGISKEVNFQKYEIDIENELAKFVFGIMFPILSILSTRTQFFDAYNEKTSKNPSKLEYQKLFEKKKKYENDAGEIKELNYFQEEIKIFSLGGKSMLFLREIEDRLPPGDTKSTAETASVPTEMPDQKENTAFVDVPAELDTVPENPQQESKNDDGEEVWRDLKQYKHEYSRDILWHEVYSDFYKFKYKRDDLFASAKLQNPLKVNFKKQIDYQKSNYFSSAQIRSQKEATFQLRNYSEPENKQNVYAGILDINTFVKYVQMENEEFKKVNQLVDSIYISYALDVENYKSKFSKEEQNKNNQKLQKAKREFKNYLGKWTTMLQIESLLKYAKQLDNRGTISNNNVEDAKRLAFRIVFYVMSILYLSFSEEEINKTKKHLINFFGASYFEGKEGKRFNFLIPIVLILGEFCYEKESFLVKNVAMCSFVSTCFKMLDDGDKEIKKLNLKRHLLIGKFVNEEINTSKKN